MRKRINILGVELDDLTLEEAAQQVISWAQAHRDTPELPTRLIVTVNPEYVMLARKDPAFLFLINSADMVTADGAGIVAAGKILGQPFRERVTGVALAERLFQLSGTHQLRIFLLGSAPGVAEEAASKLKQQYPDVQIAGTFAGQGGPEGDTETSAKVKASQADVVLVAYGVVKQDLWTDRNKQRCGAAVAIGVGGVLDYKSGRVPLAPRLIRRFGLEWAYRLYKEPRRWRRQLSLPRFVLAVGIERINQFIPKKPRA